MPLLLAFFLSCLFLFALELVMAYYLITIGWRVFKILFRAFFQVFARTVRVFLALCLLAVLIAILDSADM